MFAYGIAEASCVGVSGCCCAVPGCEGDVIPCSIPACVAGDALEGPCLVSLWYVAAVVLLGNC